MVCADSLEVSEDRVREVWAELSAQALVVLLEDSAAVPARTTDLAASSPAVSAQVLGAQVDYPEGLAAWAWVLWVPVV